MKSLHRYHRRATGRSAGMLEFTFRGSTTAADAYRRYNRRRQLGAQSFNMLQRPARSCAKDPSLRQPPPLSTFVYRSPLPPLPDSPRRAIRLQQGERTGAAQGSVSPPLSVTLPLVFSPRAHLVAAGFQARINRTVECDLLDFSSLSFPPAFSPLSLSLSLLSFLFYIGNYSQ